MRLSNRVPRVLPVSGESHAVRAGDDMLYALGFYCDDAGSSLLPCSFKRAVQQIQTKNPPIAGFTQKREPHIHVIYFPRKMLSYHTDSQGCTLDPHVDILTGLTGAFLFGPSRSGHLAPARPQLGESSSMPPTRGRAAAAQASAVSAESTKPEAMSIQVGPQKWGRISQKRYS